MTFFCRPFCCYRVNKTEENTVKAEVHTNDGEVSVTENYVRARRASKSHDENEYEDIYQVREEVNNSSPSEKTEIKNSPTLSGKLSNGSAKLQEAINGSIKNVYISSNDSEVVKEQMTSIFTSEHFAKIHQKALSVQVYDTNGTDLETNEELNGGRSSESRSISLLDAVLNDADSELTNSSTIHIEESRKESIQSNHLLKRVISEPGSPPPPPPPPPPPMGFQRPTRSHSLSSSIQHASAKSTEESATVDTSQRRSSEHSQKSNGKQTTSTASNPPPPPPLPPTAVPQAFSQQAETGPTESNTRREVEAPHQRAPKPVQRQLVLILPPHFPVGDNALVKPSEILKSIGAKGASGRPQSPAGTMPSTTRVEVSHEEVTEEVEETTSVVSVPTCGPKPPPLPASSSSVANDLGMGASHGKQQQQPLATISIHDLNSVQLRRTEKLTKTLSAPPMTSTTTSQKSLNIVTTNGGGTQQTYISHKESLIAELKMSRDISGIKKLKVEKAKEEEMQEKELYVEISKQLTADNFVQKIPEQDAQGNMIPPWKRQMLARKAAEKARREAAEEVQRAAEERRLLSIPVWKRHLIAAKQGSSATSDSTSTLTKQNPPQKKSIITNGRHKGDESFSTEPEKDVKIVSANGESNKENNKPEHLKNVDKERESDSDMPQDKKAKDSKNEEDNAQIIPWRAQLRKTNSKLNLLE